ncbi:MAG TPA: hypothetical protein VL996_02440 [Methylocella sp.]|nr:hypothetical protein [Methylocella sp.]
MSMMTETLAREPSAYGGFADALGGIATIVLAVLGLAGVHPQMLISIATIIFGVALLIEGGTMITEYVRVAFPTKSYAETADPLNSNGLSALFLVGGAGIVLGVLAVLSVHPEVLTAIAVIAFGTGLVFSSNAVWHLHTLKHAAVLAAQAEEGRGGEAIASQMASGSAGLQALAGLTGGVLGILALVGTGVDSVALILIALLVFGGAILMTGSALTGTIVSFMKKEEETPNSPARTPRSTYGQDNAAE